MPEPGTAASKSTEDSKAARANSLTTLTGLDRSPEMAALSGGLNALMESRDKSEPGVFERLELNQTGERVPEHPLKLAKLLQNTSALDPAARKPPFRETSGCPDSVNLHEAVPSTDPVLDRLILRILEQRGSGIPTVVSRSESELLHSARLLSQSTEVTAFTHTPLEGFEVQLRMIESNPNLSVHLVNRIARLRLQEYAPDDADLIVCPRVSHGSDVTRIAARSYQLKVHGTQDEIERQRNAPTRDRLKKVALNQIVDHGNGVFRIGGVVPYGRSIAVSSARAELKRQKGARCLVMCEEPGEISVVGYLVVERLPTRDNYHWDRHLSESELFGIRTKRSSSHHYQHGYHFTMAADTLILALALLGADRLPSDQEARWLENYCTKER